MQKSSSAVEKVFSRGKIPIFLDDFTVFPREFTQNFFLLKSSKNISLRAGFAYMMRRMRGRLESVN
jgi:hypothetical protein